MDHPDPIVFQPLVVGTSVRLYDDFIRFHFFHTHCESSSLINELPEESDQFRFLRTSCLTNLKDSVGLILPKDSGIRISIPLRTFISVFHTTVVVHPFSSLHTSSFPFPRTFSSTICLSVHVGCLFYLFIDSSTRHSFIVTLFPSVLAFFYSDENKTHKEICIRDMHPIYSPEICTRVRHRDSTKVTYQTFFGVLIDLIMELLGLIIKPFDNQTMIWA